MLYYFNNMKNIFNLFKSDTIAESAKWSKWSVINFVIFIIVLLALPENFIQFSNYQDWGLEILSNFAFVAFFGWILYLTIKSKKKGLRLSLVAFYGVLALSIVTLALDLTLVNDLEDVKTFAINNGKELINSDLKKLKSLYPVELSHVYDYSSSSKDIVDSFNSVGIVNECMFVDGANAKVKENFYPVFGGYKFGKLAEVSERCYGSNGYIDLFMTLKKVNEEWKLTVLNYSPSDPSLQERFSKQQKLDSNEEDK